MFFTLTLPLSYSGIIAGAVLGFARSLGEFGATITFVSNIPNQTQTIPSALFTFIENAGRRTGCRTLMCRFDYDFLNCTICFRMVCGKAKTLTELLMLQLNLHQTLGQLKLAVKLDIPNKGVTAIFGRSGAGKSSLINLIAGLSTPQKGYIRLNQQTLFDSEQRINLAPEKRKIGYVFQEHRLSRIIRWKRISNTATSGRIPLIFCKSYNYWESSIYSHAFRRVFPAAKSSVLRLAGHY
ncbi:molybdate transporter ATP-binding protein [Actinobacillus pleuropneumoniae]|nr:molybdate transporter ATP-binding protein [Actinobacillus pleuropneumoniae]